MKEKLFILGGDSKLIGDIQFQEGGGTSAHIVRLLAIITHILLKGSKSTNNVRIDNSFSLGTQVQEWDLNPDLDSLQAASLMDPGTAQLRFLSTEPPKLKPLPSPKVRIPAQA
ncbi:hypothetical protein DSO57_1004177 [Entomophthora muscae]|uniref:Uncharacterized protein n=1 Tax=Entomophthora muscae TaxID=34485 RepID=A0ACC2UU27_9FUNG|nr:hypothetical protein DSO57_1004177 [Entomophthora muscae]